MMAFLTIYARSPQQQPGSPCNRREHGIQQPTLNKLKKLCQLDRTVLRANKHRDVHSQRCQDASKCRLVHPERYEGIPASSGLHIKTRLTYWCAACLARERGAEASV